MIDLARSRAAQAQPELRSAVADFVRERVTPVAPDLDRTEAFPADLYRELAALDLFGVTVPEELGGAGGSALDYLHVMEALSFGYAAVADQVGLVEILSGLLARYGTDEQRARYLTPLLRADSFGAYCLTESHAGSDLAAVATQAVSTAQGWRLTGEKVLINNAPVADFGIVLAVTDPALGSRGLSMFLVDLDRPGVQRTAAEHKMGQRASQVGGLGFEGVELGPEAMLGEPGQGFGAMMSILAKGRLGIAGLSLGIARSAIETAIEYSTGRTAFGRAIAANQGVAFRLADCATSYRAAFLLAEDAAELLGSEQDASLACSMAKLSASECALEAVDAAVQIHGGSGYIRGSLVERLYRDARITTIYEGTSEIQRLIISRGLVGRV